MPAEHTQPERHDVVELDRQAWNLPTSRLQPVGTVREVWPVRPLPTRRVDDGPFEDPAAA